ncbi:MAG: T9SS type A sorting domain-containing protein, partial [Sphingobacteriales bacterium]
VYYDFVYDGKDNNGNAIKVIAANRNGSYLATDFNNKGVVAAFDKSGHTMWAQEIIADNVIPQQIAGSGNSVWLTGNAIDSTAFHFGSVTVTMPATAVDHYYPYAARLRISGTTTAVVEISKVKIAEVFPNPAYSQLGIKLPTNRTGQLFVSDMTGRKLLQAPLTTGMNTISVSDLARGSYIAEIVTDEGRQADILLLQ